MYSSEPLTKNEITLIRSLPPFQEIKAEDDFKKVLTLTERHSFQPGETIALQGEAGNRMELFLLGTANVFLNGVCFNSLSLKKGDLAGELSFFTGRPFLGTVVAATECVTLRISVAVFKKFLEDHPVIGMQVYSGFRLKKSFDFIECLSEEVIFLISGDISKQVAHDIITPVSALETLSKKFVTLPEEDREILRVISERIRRIASCVLDVKPEENAEALKQKNTSFFSLGQMNLTVRTTIEIMRAKTLGSSISIDFTDFIYEQKFSSQGIGLNELQFERMAANLLNNSIESCSIDGGTILVSITLIEDQIVFKVADSGKGIPDSLIPTLGKYHSSFDKPTGYGLGLLHVQEIVGSAGGKLKVNSSLNNGCVVTVSFPVKSFPDNQN